MTPTTVTRGRLATAILNLTNTGNSTASGALAVALSARTDATGSNTAVALPTVKRPVRLPAGASARLRLSFVVPKKLAAGTYYLASRISRGGRVVESGSADNLAVSETPFAVE